MLDYDAWEHVSGSALESRDARHRKGSVQAQRVEGNALRRDEWRESTRVSSGGPTRESQRAKKVTRYHTSLETQKLLGTESESEEEAKRDGGESEKRWRSTKD